MIVDNCCESRRFYQEIFGDIPVKLDIWHAIKRVVHCIPAKFAWRDKVSKAFGLIVRQKGDTDKERLKATAEPDEIMANLDRIVRESSRYLDQLPPTKKADIFAEIKNLQVCSSFLFHSSC